MRSKPRRAIAVLAAVLASCTVASCDVGPTHSLNSRSVENQILQQLSARYPMTGRVVVCPGKIPDKVGYRFTCTVAFDGGTVRLSGQVTSSKGSYNIQPDQAIVSTAQAASTLESDIAATAHAHATVDCGPLLVRVLPVGGQFACQATITGEGTRPVTVKVVDLNGHFRYSLG
ncbi:MAG TPA: DUF4333 domain-containing protein [Acidimicrobiales bacterium]|nr:DUF4333 domain-containing protein [Acidimicrobiales bacterium]